MAKGLRDFSDPNAIFPDSLRFMENAIIAFYQALFMQFPAQKNPSAYHYDDDIDNCEVGIEGRGTDNLKDVDRRPKIVVMRGPVRWQHTGPGGSNFVGSANVSAYSTKYAGMNHGSITVSCYSSEDLESDRLAQICFDSVEMFAPQLRKSAGFLTIHSAQVGQRAMIKPDARPKLFVTPVLIQASVTRNWSAMKNDPVILRQILIQLIAGPITQGG